MSKKSSTFGTAPLGVLLRQQAIPASIGILVMSIYGIVDTIFVGRWVGPLGIGAITVVWPITLLIASFGMAIGVGGASLVSRSLGEGNQKKAFSSFGNQVLLTIILASTFFLLGYLFMDPILKLFGGRGETLEPAREYFQIVLYGVPFLAWSMMSNNNIRAEGFPRMAMYTLLTPAVANIILDPIFIVWLDMGIKGAAWATTLSYIASAIYTIFYFNFGKGELKLYGPHLKLKWPIIKEIFAIGSVTLARQGTISVLSIVLNNALFQYGGELGLSTFGIIGRVVMFANFPVLGITQGFVPIVGYNFGAKLDQRVNDVIKLSVRTATLIAVCLFIAIQLSARPIVEVFTTDQALIDMATPALRLTYLATPLLAINLIGSAYFQAIGKALPALLLALTKQGFCLIPLVLLMPLVYGLDGIWVSFPIADLGATIVTLWYMRKKGKQMF
ncbi:MAG: MATE family efflux transporter [Bacteroidota bacterium]